LHDADKNRSPRDDPTDAGRSVREPSAEHDALELVAEPSLEDVVGVSDSMLDGARRREKKAFTGDLQLLAFPDLMEFLRGSRRTGTLVLTDEAESARVHFVDGRLVGTAGPATPPLKAVLAETLTLSGELLQEFAEQDDEEQLVAALSAGGLISDEELRKARVEQIHRCVEVLVEWTSGRFALEPEPAIESDIALDAQGVLLEVFRRLDEARRDG